MNMTAPVHVAIIMDGNGRWAQQKRLPRIEGHRRGIEAVRQAITAADDLGVKYLTLYSFSTENWKRPAREVKFLFLLMGDSLRREMRGLDEKNVRVKFIGRISGLPGELRNLTVETEKLTVANTGLTLAFAMNYGGRQEILDAIKEIVASGRNPGDPEISETEFGKHLYFPELPDADLVIRTAGEKRLSNFLLWQTAYSEFYFTDVLWPEFTGDDFRKACEDFGKRKRRFGGL